MPGSDGNVGKLAAFNVDTLEQTWSLEQRASVADAGNRSSGSWARTVRIYAAAEVGAPGLILMGQPGDVPLR